MHYNSMFPIHFDNGVIQNVIEDCINVCSYKPRRMVSKTKLIQSN
uniref:Uncharacterized protein n=1 Tax=Anguilla anguilla TaxID=7936 RepID=A0A0E9RUB9_ANGAN